MFILCLEHAHRCLGAWEGGPVVPGPPPLGPWGTHWGGSRPKVCRSEGGESSWVDLKNHEQNVANMYIWAPRGRRWVVLGDLGGS